MTQPEIPGTGVGIPRMPYGSNAAKWIAFLVDAAGRLQVDIVDVAGLQDALASIATDLLRVESKSGDKIFSFESILNELDLFTLANGSERATSEPVPTGRVWVITNVSIRNDSRAATGFDGGVRTNSTDVYLLRDSASVAQYIPAFFPTYLYLATGDKLYFFVRGGQNGDSVYFCYSGYQMNAP